MTDAPSPRKSSPRRAGAVVRALLLSGAVAAAQPVQAQTHTYFMEQQPLV